MLVHMFSPPKTGSYRQTLIPFRMSIDVLIHIMDDFIAIEVKARPFYHRWLGGGDGA